MKSSPPTAPGAPAKPRGPDAGATGAAGPWQALGQKASEIWGNKLVRRTAYSLAIGLLTLNLLEFPRQVYNPAHDASSHATFEYYAAHHFQFGKQVFQNVGPYGYIHYSYFYSGYLPVQRIVLKTLWRLGLVLLICWAGRRLPNPGVQLCWWAAFFIFQPFTWPLTMAGMPDFVRAQEMDWDQDYGYLTVYLAALYLLQNRKGWPFATVSGLLLFFLAFAALTKHTTFVLAAAAVGAVVLQKALRRELFAAAGTAVVYGLFLTAHWLMAGQALANLPGFVRGIFAFTAGYNEAQSVPGPALTTVIGLLVAAALCLRSVYNLRALKQGLGRTVLELFLVFTAWKHGFVAAQFAHVMTFFFAAVCVGILVFYLVIPVEGDPPPGKPAFPRLHRFAASPAVLAAGFGLILLALGRSAATADATPGESGGYRPSYLINRLKNNFNWLASPRRQMAKMREDLGKAEAFFSLPRIKAEVGQNRVDFFGMEPGWVLLNHLTYWCRPMPIVFAAWNSELARANEAFYRDARTMPEYVIYDVEALNVRFVAQDALALQALLDNYSAVLCEREFGRTFVLLKKSPLPPRDHLEKKLLYEGKALLGEKLPLHELSNQSVWAEVEITHSLLGKALSMLYKVPLCFMGYHCVGSPEGHAVRFVTQLGRSGWMLTPVVENSGDLLSLYASRNDSSPPRRIEDFGFFCEPGARRFFEPEIRIRLYEVACPTKPAD